MLLTSKDGIHCTKIHKACVEGIHHPSHTLDNPNSHTSV